MEWLVWIGALIALGGVAGLVWCILHTVKARREGLSDEAMRARLQRVVAINLGALMLSVLGLMMVVIGILLG